MRKNHGLAQKHTKLHARANIVQSIRSFFSQRGYLEVETPFRIPAPAPESHIDAVPSGDWFLHTSPELCMKRLLAAGFEQIFQISKCWRAGERGTRHTPEFTLLEWYHAGVDYNALMDEGEILVQAAASGIGLMGDLIYQGHTISLAAPWERITVREAFFLFGGMSMEEALNRDLFDEVMVTAIEPNLGIKKPTFIFDYPITRGALARSRRDDPTVA